MSTVPSFVENQRRKLFLYSFAFHRKNVTEILDDYQILRKTIPLSFLIRKQDCGFLLPFLPSLPLSLLSFPPSPPSFLPPFPPFPLFPSIPPSFPPLSFPLPPTPPLSQVKSVTDWRWKAPPFVSGEARGAERPSWEACPRGSLSPEGGLDPPAPAPGASRPPEPRRPRSRLRSPGSPEEAEAPAR